MRFIILSFLLIISIPSISKANELIDAYFKAFKSYEIVQYKTIFKSFEKDTQTFCDTALVRYQYAPNDTVFGFKYNFQMQDKNEIYSDEEFIDYNLEYNPSKIAIVINKKDEEYEFNTRSRIKIENDFFVENLYYSYWLDFSIPYLISNFKKILDTNKIVLESDTLIKNQLYSKIELTVFENPLHELFYYKNLSIVFDKTTHMPIFYKQISNNYTNEFHFSNFLFKSNNIDYFSRKAIPSDIKFINSNYYDELKKSNEYLSLDYSIAKKQNSLNIGFSATCNIYAPKDNGHFLKSNNGLSFKINVFGLEWLKNDSYNASKSNYSYFTNWTGLWTSALILSQKIFPEITGSELYLWALATPPILANSTFAFAIDQSRTYDFNYLNTSLFVGSKIDYFNRNAIKFWRYNPSFGLELAHIFVGGAPVANNNYSVKKSNALFLNIGAAYPIDFLVNGKPHTSGFVPSFGVRFAIGG